MQARLIYSCTPSCARAYQAVSVAPDSAQMAHGANMSSPCHRARAPAFPARKGLDGRRGLAGPGA
eukprot:264791-Prymnesium_polylepis.1